MFWNFIQHLLFGEPTTPKNDWWHDLTCISCHETLTQEPHSYCGHCKRTLCKKCGYVPGGCGWCGG
jgi:hypothetical protein